jgi:transcriptional activator of cad operon
MTAADNPVYRVGSFKVNVIQRQVVTPAQTINVRPKTFSLLLVFLQNPFLVLQKEFLLNQVWDDVCVEDLPLAYWF